MNVKPRSYFAFVVDLKLGTNVVAFSELFVRVDLSREFLEVYMQVSSFYGGRPQKRPFTSGTVY